MSAEPAETEPRTTEGGGKLAFNVMQFCRCLRAAGLPVGPGATLNALEAVQAVGIGTRQDLYWTLHAALVTRRDQKEVFDQAFHLFWRNPDLLRRAMALMLPEETVPPGARDREAKQVSRRVAEAMRNPPQDDRDRAKDDEEQVPEIELDARLTVSESERLRSRDFEQMTAAEVARALALIHRMRLPVPDLRTRRFYPVPSAGARVDLRQTIRRTLRGGGDVIDLAHRRRCRRPPPLVILCDVSGSMSQYSRMALHFMHAVTTDRDRVHSFVFGTRLTNITRYLRTRDVDEALAKVGEAVGDWAGGTRIGECLHRFNRDWARRVLGQGAVLLLITDGLDRDVGDTLSEEVALLHRSCRRLIWLNPLLRYDGYAPKSLGARALMPHVDDFRPVHNLDSLADLVEALADDAGSGWRRMTEWRAAARQEREDAA